MSSSGRVVIYGGKGALGSAIVQLFKKNNWWVGSIDLKENSDADKNVVVEGNASWQDQQDSVINQLSEALGDEKVAAVICVAGGWAGGNAASPDLVKNSDLMWRQSVWSSIISATIAAKFLKEGGLLTLTGANPALEGTPGMIGYGMAKAAVHQLTKSLAATDSGLPSNSLVVSILPVTLDTPMNRKWMADADTSTWTPLEFVAGTFLRWTNGEDRPKSGSLISLITAEGETKLISK